MANVDQRHRPPKVIRLYGGRLRVEYRYDAKNYLDTKNELDASVLLAPKTADTKFSDCVIVEQGLTGADAGQPNQLVRAYETLTTTFVDEVAPEKTTEQDGRSGFDRILVALPDADASAIVIGAAYLTNFAAQSITDLSDEYRKRFKVHYIEANATPAQIGNVTARQAGPRAFVDTHASTGAVLSTTRFAREWVVRYVVAGDATAIDTQWLAVNASLAFGTRTGYLTSTSIERQGVAFSIIARVYNEVPDKLIYPQRGRYFFPGKLGVSNAEPYVSQPGVTRETTFLIEETYATGEMDPDPLTFEVLYWAQGVTSYTVDATSQSGTQSYRFNGCIGNVTVASSNRIFNGVYCATIAGNIASNPSTYPSGAKLISSQVFPWKGDIWIKRNTSVTFP